MKNQISESKLKSLRIKKANDCYKREKGDCLVSGSGTLRLFSYCDYCQKLELQSKEIKIPKYKIKKFKFPIDLIDYPLKKTKKIKIINEKGKNTLELFLSGYYGEYHIEAPRKFKLMDYRTLLATLYFIDYHKNKTFKNKFIDWLDLLEVEDTKFYRKSIIMGIDFLLDLKFYTPYIYDLQLKRRSSSFNLTEKGEIDYSNLPSFSVFRLINSYHHIREKSKRKSKIKVELNDIFYKRIFLNKYYTLIDFKKILPLKDIALNLYFFIKKQDPKNISNYTIDFKNLKTHIGITDTNITNAKKTFEKAWNDIKNTGILKGYQHRFFISKKDSKRKIKFSKPKDLIKIYKEKLNK